MSPETLFGMLELIKLSFYWLAQLVQPTAYLSPQKAAVESGNKYDYIIVGAGTAGCLVANRLTEDPDINVLLIEAGSDAPLESTLPAYFPFLPRTINDWNYTSTNNNYTYQYTKKQKCELTAGKMLGGSSGLHHLIYARGHPSDYDLWADAIGDDAWNHDNILPYLKKSEKLIANDVLDTDNALRYGTTGEVILSKKHHEVNNDYLTAFKEVGNEIKTDLNGEENGYGEPLLYIGNDVRQSSAESFLRQSKDRKNLNVLKNTEVTKILFDDSNNAVGVKAVDDNGKELELYANFEVILSAGALNSPKILMLSGVGPSNILENLGIAVLSNLPVGVNLQDHPGVLILHKMGESSGQKKSIDPHTFGPPAFIGYASFRNESKPDYQTINLIIPHNSIELFYICASLFNFYDEICKTMYDASQGRNVLITYLNLLRPSSKGNYEVTSKNPKTPPKVKLGTFEKESDLNDITNSVLHFLNVQNSQFFKSVAAETVDLNFKECKGLKNFDYWKCYALNAGNTLWHYIGTCSLGAVVDTNLKVVGVEKLRVVDGSVMPVLIGGNINSAVMGIAEKACDIIKKERV